MKPGGWINIQSEQQSQAGSLSPGHPVTLSPGQLQAAIDAKNSRHAHYTQHCDECWLLIVASGGRPSGLFEASDDTGSHEYRSLFARTFFMEAFSGVLLELSTTAA